jgi:hypothetical protein
MRRRGNRSGTCICQTLVPEWCLSWLEGLRAGRENGGERTVLSAALTVVHWQGAAAVNTGGVVLVGAVPAVVGIVGCICRWYRRWERAGRCEVIVVVGAVVGGFCRRVACIRDTTLGFATMSL